MRTLCLNLQRAEKPSVAENFLPLSPRIHYREPGYVFADITSTAQLLGGEASLLKKALQMSKTFFPYTRAAIADSPAAAQAFTAHSESYISKPRHDREELSGLPLSTLNHLEGLIAWRSAHEVEEIVDFFHVLGMKNLSELHTFRLESFRERWGETGTLLWQRLHGQDTQVISPLLPSESLEDYVHLDFPVSLVPFLIHCLEKSFQKTFARLQGRGEFARKIILHLHCEYSGQRHLVELVPAQPNRQLDLYMKLLEHKLVDLDLDNPIQEFEVEVVTCPEKVQQLDFWEPRVSDREKLDQLISVFHQAGLTTGFFQPKNEIMPEDSWVLIPEYEDYTPMEDTVDVEGQSFQIRPAYSQALTSAPRPSRLLEQPKALSAMEVRRLQFLSSHPVERLEDSWWEDSRGRDYYFALSPKGQCLWVYHDRIEDQYYLHGYFD